MTSLKLTSKYFGNLYKCQIQILTVLDIFIFFAKNVLHLFVEDASMGSYQMNSDLEKME